MEIVTGVITVAGNNDNETVYDFGLESSVEDQMMTGAITAAGNIDHDTVMNIGIESFVGDLSSDDEFAVAAAAVMVTGRSNFAYNKNQIDAGSKRAPTKRWTCLNFNFGIDFETKIRSFVFSVSQFPGMGGRQNTQQKKHNKIVETANTLIDPNSSSIWLSRMNSTIRNSLVKWT